MALLILAARFQNRVEEDGAPLALWQALTAAKKEVRDQVRRATLLIAALQICLALGVSLLLHLPGG